MHNIYELKEMAVEQLNAIAENLKIKGYKKMDVETLRYAILDEEAVQNAMKAPEKSEKPKRGRPRKETKTELPKKEAEAQTQKKEKEQEQPKKQEEVKKSEGKTNKKEEPKPEVTPEAPEVVKAESTPKADKPAQKKRNKKAKADRKEAAQAETVEVQTEPAAEPVVEKAIDRHDDICNNENSDNKRDRRRVKSNDLTHLILDKESLSADVKRKYQAYKEIGEERVVNVLFIKSLHFSSPSFRQRVD